MPRQKRYQGVLAKPIDYPYDPPEEEESIRAYEVFEARETHAKYVPIFEHYNLMYGAWQDLAILLLIEHVPGFEFRFGQSLNRGGRPKEWPDDILIKLAQDIHMVREAAPYAKRRTIKGACEYIAKAPDYPQWHPRKGQTLTKWVKVLSDRYREGMRIMEAKNA